MAISGFTLTLNTTISRALSNLTVTFPLQVKLDAAPGVTQSSASVAQRLPEFQGLPTP
jgi:hypothetical protein